MPTDSTPHLEPVEPRRLLANTGLDTAFGTAGAAGLVGGDEVKAILPTATGIYVDVWSYGQPTRHYVRKLTAAGRLEKTWGDNGSTRVPVGTTTYGVNAGGQLAYDAATNKLYVAGGTDVGGFSIARLNATGKLDTAFGNGGFAIEAAKDDGNEFSSDTRLFNGMTPLPGGKLLVSFSRGNAPDFYGTFTQTDELKLWRLTNAGRPDTTFGKDGQATVASGGGRVSISDHGDYSRTNTSQFADVQLYPDGAVRVVSLLVNRIESNSYGFGDDRQNLSQSQYVQSRVVTADGVVQSPTTVPLANDAYSRAPAERQVAYHAVLVRADGRYTRVVGARGTESTRTATPTIAAGDLTVTTIAPSGRAYATAFKASGGAFGSIVATAARTAVFSGTRLSVLNNDATPAKFGKAGSVAVNAGLTAAALDDRGLVLAADGATLLRFDGQD